jgi:hypothetical protein
MYRQSVRTATLLGVLTAIPTAIGYVLGPISHATDAVFKAVGLPFNVGLGFATLALVCILARHYLGRGGALAQGILLGLTGVIFHPGQSFMILFPRDVLLGLGVEIPLLATDRIGGKGTLAASILGGALSYLPYMFFVPLTPTVFFSAYAVVLLLAMGKMISAALGGWIAFGIIRVVPFANHLEAGTRRVKVPLPMSSNEPPRKNEGAS